MTQVIHRPYVLLVANNSNKIIRLNSIERGIIHAAAGCVNPSALLMVRSKILLLRSLVFNNGMGSILHLQVIHMMLVKKRLFGTVVVDGGSSSSNITIVLLHTHTQGGIIQQYAQEGADR